MAVQGGNWDAGVPRDGRQGLGLNAVSKARRHLLIGSNIKLDPTTLTMNSQKQNSQKQNPTVLPNFSTSTKKPEAKRGWGTAAAGIGAGVLVGLSGHHSPAGQGFSMGVPNLSRPPAIVRGVGRV